MFGRSRNNRSASIPAVCLTNAALPYSLSYTAIGRTANCLQTCLSWKAARERGVSKLVMRSCLKGKAQLPCASGIQAMVLNPCPTAIGLLPAIGVGWCSMVRSFRVTASGRDQAVWSPANRGRSSLPTCSMYSCISFRLGGLLLRNPAYRLDHARRNTGDSDSSTNELTRGLVRTASIRSKMASFPLPSTV